MSGDWLELALAHRLKRSLLSWRVWVHSCLWILRLRLWLRAEWQGWETYCEDGMFRIRGANKKWVKCYGISFSIDARYISFLIDSFVEYWFANQPIILIWVVPIEPFVDANLNERVSSSILTSHFYIILPPHSQVILHAGLARSCRIHISKIKGKSSPLGRRSLAGRMRGDWQEL